MKTQSIHTLLAQRSPTLETIIRAVNQLRNEAIALEQEFADELQQIHPSNYPSACNLIHYLAVRAHDVRDLQRDLSLLGLSSLGRMEAHVMASLNAVLAALHRLDSRPVPPELEAELPITQTSGANLLAANTIAILGHTPEHRAARIMVTMPSEAADKPEIIHDLLRQGMNIMRINCAHDDRQAWTTMIQHLRDAERRSERVCRVSFDLAGPKLRTEAVIFESKAIKWRPTRNQLGQVIAPAIICFSTQPQQSPDYKITVPINGTLVGLIEVGDTLTLTDTRGYRCYLKVVETFENGWLGEAQRTAYVTAGTELDLYRDGELIATDAIAALPASPRRITLMPGDTLTVVRPDPAAKLIHSKAAILADDSPHNHKPPKIIGCTLPEVFRDVQAGERIFFDDGKIAGIIREVADTYFQVRITAVAKGKAKLRGEKGINLPDTNLNLPALTSKDRQDLEFVAQHGDMVAMSFVQHTSDIKALIAELARLDANQLGIVLKIETQRAFERLPRLLLAALRHPRVAVMVARGDLGVEVGFERLSEVQEEILWLCEAAHVPVIWATQVLESLAKGGMPSRAEVTDAAMGSRAECVMLNKGPYIDRAMHFLADVLQRMKAHQEKKTSMLRQLSISDIHPRS
jgi:pyruvate kinase